MDFRDYLNMARKEGLEEGRKEGLEQGRKEGLEEAAEEIRKLKEQIAALQALTK